MSYWSKTKYKRNYNKSRGKEKGWKTLCALWSESFCVLWYLIYQKAQFLVRNNDQMVEVVKDNKAMVRGLLVPRKFSCRNEIFRVQRILIAEVRVFNLTIYVNVTEITCSPHILYPLVTRDVSHKCKSLVVTWKPLMQTTSWKHSQ